MASCVVPCWKHDSDLDSARAQANDSASPEADPTPATSRLGGRQPLAGNLGVAPAPALPLPNERRVGTVARSTSCFFRRVFLVF